MGVDLIGVFVSVLLLTDLVSRRSMLIAVVVHTEVTTAFDKSRNKRALARTMQLLPTYSLLIWFKVGVLHRCLVSCLERAG